MANLRLKKAKKLIGKNNHNTNIQLIKSNWSKYQDNKILWLIYQLQVVGQKKLFFWNSFFGKDNYYSDHKKIDNLYFGPKKNLVEKMMAQNKLNW